MYVYIYIYIYIYIYTEGRGWGFPGRQLKFSVVQFEHVHWSLCFAMFCVLPITREYQELVRHAATTYLDMLSAVSMCCFLPQYICFLVYLFTCVYLFMNAIFLFVLCLPFPKELVFFLCVNFRFLLIDIKMS